uniref:Uncharacterized protein n=2 Tax=Salmonella sp. TaxID=599 RepID=A0A482EUP5_SALSP|nr:hypothetical protein NNIBIDOC_00228 [Salmonella sp.]
MATVNAQLEVNAAITALLKMESPELNNGRHSVVARDSNVKTYRYSPTDVVIKSVSYQLTPRAHRKAISLHNTVTLQCKAGNTSINRSNISSVLCRSIYPVLQHKSRYGSSKSRFNKTSLHENLLVLNIDDH